MSEPTTPRAFVSHSSADKERFVLGFARKLWENGIEAWVDRWEMLPGDNLVEKVYEEGLGGADAVVAVVSENSIESPWVQDELNTAKVRQITGRCKLIPVILDDVDEGRIPVALANTVWERIRDLNGYNAELRRIVDAIHGRIDRPELGRQPAYVTSPIDALPGLNRIDSVVLKICGDLAVEAGDSRYPLKPEPIFARAVDLDIGEEQTADSLEILEDKGFASLAKVHGGDGRGIVNALLSRFGFERYLSSYLNGYNSLVRDVGFELLNSPETQQDADEVACTVGVPVAIVIHIVRRVRERNLV